MWRVSEGTGVRAYIVGGMRRRDPDEQHRASTPLELLFDLTFVVAVAHVAADSRTTSSTDHVGTASSPT